MYQLTLQDAMRHKICAENTEILFAQTGNKIISYVFIADSQ
jgi:hypothetical protein